MRCPKCHYKCDTGDAFCRKCGFSLIQEADYYEVISTADNNRDQKSVTKVQIIDQNPTNLNSPLGLSIKSKALERVAQVLSSETGQKVVKSAALVALGVASEIISHATDRQKQKNERLAQTSGLLKKVISSVNHPEEINSGFFTDDAGSGGREEHFFFYRERWVFRRTNRNE